MVRLLLLPATAIAAATLCRRLRLPLSLRRPLPTAPSFFASRAAMGSDSYSFGPYKIAANEVFHTSDLSYAMVNLRPVVPGHILFPSWEALLRRKLLVELSLFSCPVIIYFKVLVCPRREVKRFVDLSSTEISDLWITAQNVGAKLECYHEATSLTFSIQDGPQAGQTVPHVHIHILPRKSGDFAKNDEIYDAIDENEKEQKLDLDRERVDRTPEEMAAEAAEYRALFS